MWLDELVAYMVLNVKNINEAKNIHTERNNNKVLINGSMRNKNK